MRRGSAGGQHQLGHDRAVVAAGHRHEVDRGDARSAGRPARGPGRAGGTAAAAAARSRPAPARRPRAASSYPSPSTARSAAWSNVALKSPASTRSTSGAGAGRAARSCVQPRTAAGDVAGGTVCTEVTSTTAPPSDREPHGRLLEAAGDLRPVADGHPGPHRAGGRGHAPRPGGQHVRVRQELVDARGPQGRLGARRQLLDGEDVDVVPPHQVEDRARAPPARGAGSPSPRAAGRRRAADPPARGRRAGTSTAPASAAPEPAATRAAARDRAAAASASGRTAVAAAWGVKDSAGTSGKPRSAPRRPQDRPRRPGRGRGQGPPAACGTAGRHRGHGSRGRRARAGRGRGRAAARDAWCAGRRSPTFGPENRAPAQAGDREGDGGDRAARGGAEVRRRPRPSPSPTSPASGGPPPSRSRSSTTWRPSTSTPPTSG